MNAHDLRVEEQVAPYLVAPDLTDYLDTFASAPEGFKRLRELVLNLAVRGRLTSNGVGNELPDEWSLSQFGDCAEVVRGITFPASEKSKAPEPGRIACLRTANIQDEVELHDLLFVRESFLSRPEQLVRKGDLVMSMANSKELVGKVAQVAQVPFPCAIGGFLAIIRGTRLSNDFLLVLLRSPGVRASLIDSSTQTTNIANISLSRLRPLPVAVPPLPEQSRIVAKVDELMALIDRLEAKVSHGETARGKLLDALLAGLADSPDAAATADAWAQLAPHFELLLQTPADVDRLQQTLLTLAVKGRLVPQDPNDEPAAELLKRIRAEKDRLVAEGKIRPNKSISSFSVDEQSFVLPSGWRWAQFGEVSICRDGERIPVSSEERAKRNKVYDYYGASGVIDKIDGYLFDGTLLLIGEDGANLINRSTPIAFLAQGKFWVNNHAHVIDGLGVGLLDYLCLFINAISLEPYVTGTAQPKMNQAKLNSIPIALPPAAEQRRIVAAVASLTALCDRLRERLGARRALSAKLATALTETALQ